MNAVNQRTFSVRQERELLLKLEAAGLTYGMAQMVIDSGSNVLAGVLLQLAEQAGCGILVDKDQWINREIDALANLAGAGFPMVNVDLIAKNWRSDFTFHDRYQPEGLEQAQLLTIAGRLGMKLNGVSVNSTLYDGIETLLTQRGVFELNTDTVWRSTNKEGHPFMLTHDEVATWAIGRGGSGLSTVEECLYNGFLRPFVEAQPRMVPYMGGFLRCANKVRDSGLSSGLYWCSDLGLYSRCGGRDLRYWNWSGLVRKFNPALAA